MVVEGSPSGVGDAVGGIGFAADEALSHFDEFFFFQGLDMTGQAAIGHLKGFLESVEIDPVIYQQDRHDAQPDTVVEGFI